MSTTLRWTYRVAFGVSAAVAIGLPYTSQAAEKKAASAHAPAAQAQPAVQPAVELAPVEEDSLELVRAELRSGKTAVLARTLRFSSDEQAAAFWPLYRQYQTDLAAINDTRIAIVKDYLVSYDTLDNPKAKDLLDRSLNSQMEIVKLRQKYAKLMCDKVSPMVAASFMQIDGLLQNLVDLDAKSELPLVADRLTEQKTAEATK